MKKDINRKNENDELDIKNDLFIIPMAYENEINQVQEFDDSIHFSTKEASMYKNGSKIWCIDLPDNFSISTTQGNSPMHYQTIAKPTGERYMPLFTSYTIMSSIFGNKYRVGVICYETAKQFCLNEGFEGIVVAPGTLNKIIPKEELK